VDSSDSGDGADSTSEDRTDSTSEDRAGTTSEDGTNSRSDGGATPTSEDNSGSRSDTMSGSDDCAVLDHRVSDDYDMHSPPQHSEDESMEDNPGTLNLRSGIGKLTLYIYYRIL
jgi:hypothetical protein